MLTAADIPGKNDCSPVKGDDPIFAKDEIMYHGQTLFAVVADTRAQARDAVAQVKTKITPLAPILSIDAAIEQKSFLQSLDNRKQRVPLPEYPLFCVYL